MIPLLQMKTADTAHMGIFANNTRPLSQLLGGAWEQGYIFMDNKIMLDTRLGRPLHQLTQGT